MRQRAKLERELGADLITLLLDPLTQDLVVNPDGRVWVERQGGRMEEAGYLSEPQRRAVIETVAGFHNDQVDLRTPTIDCELPIAGSPRFAGEIPPVVFSPSFSIRKHASTIYPLATYVETGVMTNDQCIRLREAVANHESILIVGGTGSGKTTLVNGLLQEIVEHDPLERVLVVEDTRELQCTARNAVQFHTSPHVTMTDLVRGCLRRRPDRIIVGEVRGPEARDLLMAWNTGHPGGVATIHANNAAAGLSRLSTLVSMHAHAPREIPPLIAEAIDLLVYISRHRADGIHTRIVKEILELRGFKDGSYITNPLCRGADPA